MDFQEFYTPLIVICGHDYHLTDEEIEDLRQEVMVDLFKNNVISKYDPRRGRFRGLLRTIIHHKAYRIYQKRLPNTEALTEENSGVVDSQEGRWEDEWRAFLQEVALKQLRESADEQQYMAFDLYVLQEKDPKTVASILGFSVNQVYLAKNRLGAKLREIVEQLEREEND